MNNFKYYIQKLLSIILTFLCICLIISLVFTNDIHFKNLLICLILILGISSFLLFKIKKNNNFIEKSPNIIDLKTSTKFDDTINQFNLLKNITIRIDFETTPITSFLLDDNSKKFAYVGKKDTFVFNYSDLLNFEYKENNVIIIPSQELQTKTNEFDFDFDKIGSIIKYCLNNRHFNTDININSDITLYLNNLINPNIDIDILNSSTISSKNIVINIINILNYINNIKNSKNNIN